MIAFPIYKPNAAAPIFVRIHCPAEQKAWDKVLGALKPAAETNNADTLIEVAWDAVLMKYSLAIPDGLPTGKEYDIVAYTDASQGTVHLGRRVYLDATKGFIHAEKTHIPSWV